MVKKITDVKTFNEEELKFLYHVADKATDKFKLEVTFDVNDFLKDLWQRFGFKRKLTWKDKVFYALAGSNIGVVVGAAAALIGMLF